MYFARMLTNQKQADTRSLEYASDYLHETATSFVLSSRGERNCGLAVGHGRIADSKGNLCPLYLVYPHRLWLVAQSLSGLFAVALATEMGGPLASGQ